jgi:hypothetical protein
MSDDPNSFLIPEAFFTEWFGQQGHKEGNKEGSIFSPECERMAEYATERHATERRLQLPFSSSRKAARPTFRQTHQAKLAIWVYEKISGCDFPDKCDW